MENGILDKYDNEEVIGYRKRYFTAEEIEEIYAQALDKYLPQTQEGYRKVLREMLEINGDRPWPKNNEELLLLYHEYEGVKREKQKRQGNDQGEKISGVILNPNFREKKQKELKSNEESLEEIRKWIDEEAEKAENERSEQADEVKLLTPEEHNPREDSIPVQEQVVMCDIPKESNKRRKLGLESTGSAVTMCKPKVLFH